METITFEELGLCPEIERAVRFMGFEEASPIQTKAIPAIISGKDIIGQAQTGTGKNRCIWYSTSSEDRPEKIKSFRQLYFVRQESLQYRLQMKSVILRNICTESRFFQFTVDRIL